MATPVAPPPPPGQQWPPPSPLPPPPAPPPGSDADRDPGFGHFLRYLGVSLLASLSIYVIVGFIWQAHICNRTGYRKRDLLLLFVPVVGWIVGVKVMWRYTARTVYWTPRDDRPSDLLRGWQRPWAIGGGYVAFAAFIAFFVIVALNDGWTASQRRDLIASFQEEGVDYVTAACMADEVIEIFPDRFDFNTADRLDIAEAVQRAVRICIGPVEAPPESIAEPTLPS